MTQPPLLPSAGLALDLKSPVFRPRPGWGGRLNRRFIKTVNSNRFSLWLAVFTFVLSFYSVRQYAVQQAANAFIIETVTTQPSAAAQDSAYLELAPQPGQGPFQLARLALEQYLAARPDLSLSAAQRLYVENYLTGRIAALRIRPDEIIVVDLALFQEAIGKAKQLYK